MKFTAAIPLVILLTAPVVTAFAQSAPASGPASAPAAAPAAKAEMPPGMRRYFLVLLLRAPKWGEGTPEQRKADFAGHFANMERMAAEGKLVLAGPFDKGADNDGHFAGLFLLTVDTIEAVRKETAQDPTIRNGRFELQILPWLGPVGITYPELEKILKEKPSPAPASAPNP